MNLRVAEISDAASAAELWRVVRGYYRARGFRGFAYFMTSRGGPGARRGFNIVHRGFSRAVEQAYITEGWGEKDPLPQVVISRGAPTRWSRAWALIEPDDEQMEFLTRMRAAELGDGVTLPVYGPAGRNGSVNVGAAVEENVLDTAPVEEMHMVAQVAHMRL